VVRLPREGAARGRCSYLGGRGKGLLRFRVGVQEERSHSSRATLAEVVGQSFGT
jgi:hypothetical protein